MSTPIPLVVARDYEPTLTHSEAATLERMCERNAQWVERGADKVLVDVAEVRVLIGLVLRLTRGAMRAAQPTIDDWRGRP